MRVKLAEVLCLLWLLGLCIPVQGAAALPFRLGVINELPDKPDHALRQYDRLHTYLERELAAKGIATGRLVIARSINEMANLVANGEVSAVIEGVMPTLVIARRSGGFEPALLAWRKGQRQYHSVFFARRDSGIRSLADLKGRTIAFEAPRSTSAFFVPRATLLAEGIGLAAVDNTAAAPDVVHYLFAGSELNQAYWVHRGRADAGAFNDGDWERVPETIRGDLEIIHRTRPLLRWLVSFTGAVDPAVRAAVIEALFNAEADELGSLALEDAARIKKFERLTDEDRENLAYWSEVLDVGE